MPPLTDIPTLGWSAFAIERHAPSPDRTYFKGTHEALLELVRQNWHLRQPGFGRKDLTEVVVVPFSEPSVLGQFVSRWTEIDRCNEFTTKITRRRPEEDPYLLTTGNGDPLPVQNAQVILYHKSLLTQNGETRSTDATWEIVALIASPWKEPMQPLTMARNFLQKTGGTFAPYTAEQFAEAIYFWSTRVPCS